MRSRPIAEARVVQEGDVFDFRCNPAIILVCDTLFHAPFLAHTNAVPLAAPASALRADVYV